MENSNPTPHSFILQSRIHRFRHLSELINTAGVVIARKIWKLFAKSVISDKDKEMKPWE